MNIVIGVPIMTNKKLRKNDFLYRDFFSSLGLFLFFFQELEMKYIVVFFMAVFLFVTSYRNLKNDFCMKYVAPLFGLIIVFLLIFKLIFGDGPKFFFYVLGFTYLFCSSLYCIYVNYKQ